MTQTPAILIKTPAIGGEFRLVEAATYAGGKYLRAVMKRLDRRAFGHGGTDLCIHWTRVEKCGQHIEAQGLTWERA